MDRDRHRVTHSTNTHKFMCKFLGCRFKGTPRKDYLLKHMHTRHESITDLASKNSVRIFYEAALKEEAISQPEERILKFLEAASEGDKCSVQDFISKDMSPCVMDSKGTTAVDRAIAKRHLSVLHVLVQAGVDVNTNKSDPWLHQATRNKDFEAADLLLTAGASTLATTVNKTTVLEEIIMDDCRETIALLRKHKVLERLRAGGVQFYFEIAIKHGNIAVMEMLCELGAKVEATSQGSSVVRPSLHIAAEAGQVAAAKFLLGRGADIESWMRQGGNALCLAIKNGHVAMVEFLLDCGASFTSPTPATMSLKHTTNYQVDSRNQGIVHLLLLKGAGIGHPALYQIELVHSWLGCHLSLSSNYPESGGSCQQLGTVKKLFLSDVMFGLLRDFGADKKEGDRSTPSIPKLRTWIWPQMELRCSELDTPFA